MPLESAFEKATTAEAASRLQKAAGTIASWGTRYHARKINIRGVTYWDMHDLRVIEREIKHGHAVPASPEERAAIRFRCPLKAADASSAMTAA